MTARGSASRSAARAAARAARAHTRSVRASVRTSGWRSATATVTVAPARRSEPASSASEARSPTVEPSETRRMSGSDGDDIAPEARRAHELDRAQRARALDVERGSVAILDRRHRLLLMAHRDRKAQRKAREDARHLRELEGHRAVAD